MRPIARVILILAVCLGAPRIECGCAETTAPLRVILDADLDSDVDDVGALAMLMNLHNRGLIELIGVIITSDDPFAPSCARVLLDHFGTKEIPIGFLKHQSRLTQHSRYTRKLVEEFSVTPMAWQSAEDAAPIYRKLLADSPDASVALITIGHLSSLQALLKSAPDAYSQLTGIDLAHQKIRRWICMGGQYPSGKEANFYRPDPASTLYCLEHWRGSALFCGWEAGNPILTGGSRLKELLPSRDTPCTARTSSTTTSMAGRAGTSSRSFSSCRSQKSSSAAHAVTAWSPPTAATIGRTIPQATTNTSHCPPILPNTAVSRR